MEEELQESGEPIDFTEIKGIVRRRRWQFLVTFFMAWALVWGASWLLPSTYRSGTLILVEQPSVPEKYVVSNIDSDIQQQLESITQQILSRTRLLRIIDSLGLYAQDRKHKTPDDLVEKMRKDIEIELSHGDDRKLSAFYIYYASRDPKMAQMTTAELANLFITENLEQRQRRSENTTNFLVDQLEQARAKLAAQEAKMRVFKDQHLGELPTQTQSNLQILTGLQSQVQANEDALNHSKQQNAYLESLINQYRSTDQGSKPGESGSSGLAEIDKELEQLKVQLADLTSHYTDKHPDVRKTREQIARTEGRRERMVADMKNRANNPAPEAPQSDSPDNQKSQALLELESQLKANRFEIANRQSEIKDEQAKINQYQARLNLAPVMEQQFADITRDYDQSKADYESLLAKKNQSQMSTNLEKTQQGEHFRMLDPPNLPVKPYKPNRLQLCALGLALGFVLGSGFAFAQEKLSGKIYSEREIKKLVPFEVIAEIPPIESEGTVRQPAERLDRGRGGGGDRRFCPVRVGGNVPVRLRHMYKKFYNLQRNPFEITPDPSFLFPTTRHNEALASLYYGVTAHRGFVVLTGEVGTGKTLILRSLLGLLQRRDVAFALIFNPSLSPLEFMRYIAGDFGLPVAGKAKDELIHGLNNFLLQRHEQRLTSLLVVDEAHHLSAELLEEIRLLTNLETSQQKLLQIVLAGQPELDQKLDSYELRQLKQRIALRCHLEPLSLHETSEYMRRRLQISGAPAARFFPSLRSMSFSITPGEFRGSSTPSARTRCSRATPNKRPRLHKKSLRAWPRICGSPLWPSSREATAEAISRKPAKESRPICCWP